MSRAVWRRASILHWFVSISVCVWSTTNARKSKMQGIKTGRRPLPASIGLVCRQTERAYLKSRLISSPQILPQPTIRPLLDLDCTTRSASMHLHPLLRPKQLYVVNLLRVHSKILPNENQRPFLAEGSQMRRLTKTNSTMGTQRAFSCSFPWAVLHK